MFNFRHHIRVFSGSGCVFKICSRYLFPGNQCFFPLTTWINTNKPSQVAWAAYVNSIWENLNSNQTNEFEITMIVLRMVSKTQCNLQTAIIANKNHSWQLSLANEKLPKIPCNVLNALRFEIRSNQPEQLTCSQIAEKLKTIAWEFLGIQ